MHGLLHVVRDDDDGVLSLSSVKDVLDLGRGDRVEGRRRLVQQGSPRLHRQGPRNAHALRLTAGERAAADLLSLSFNSSRPRPA